MDEDIVINLVFSMFERYKSCKKDLKMFVYRINSAALPSVETKSLDTPVIKLLSVACCAITVKHHFPVSIFCIY